MPKPFQQAACTTQQAKSWLEHSTADSSQETRRKLPGILTVLCCCIQVVRIINVVLFWPILARIGSGIDLSSAATTAWSGIRGCAFALSRHAIHQETLTPLCCCAQVVRVINIISFWPILARTGPGIDLPRAAATAWSGVRGFVGLILALMVSVDTDIQDEPYKLLCLFFMATTACLTIITQGGIFELVLWVSCCCASSSRPPQPV